MNEALLVSNLVLWVIVVVLAAVVVALTRQIGVLHERIAPVGALAIERGPAVGDATPAMWLPAVDGRRVRVGGPDPDGARTLLFFLSPSCPVCEALLPTLARVAADQSPAVRVVYASDGPPEEHRARIRAHGLEGADYVLSEALGLHFAVAKLPYAVLLDGDGVVRARGLVNTREHLESLFEAERLGVASLQDHLRAQHGARESHRDTREVGGSDARDAAIGPLAESAPSHDAPPPLAVVRSEGRP